MKAPIWCTRNSSGAFSRLALRPSLPAVEGITALVSNFWGCSHVLRMGFSHVENGAMNQQLGILGFLGAGRGYRGMVWGRFAERIAGWCANGLGGSKSGLGSRCGGRL